MKKTLIGIAAFMSFATITNAREYLNYDWSLKQGNTSNYLYYDETIEADNSYITVSIDEYNTGIMRKVSKSGEKIWEVMNYYGLYYGCAADENYYYALFIGNTDEFYDNLYIARVNKETGEINNDYLWLEEDETIYDGEIYAHDGKVYVITRGYANGKNGAKNVYIVDAATFTISEQKDYSKLSKAEINEITFNHEPYISEEEWYDIYPEEHEEIIVSNQFNSENYIYVVGEVCNDTCEGFVMQTDKNLNVKWLQKNKDYYYFDVSSPTEDFVAVVAYQDPAHIGYNRNPQTVKSYLLIYDLNGNMVKQIDVANDVGVQRIDITHITESNKALLAQAFAYDETNTFSSYLIRYYPDYSIETDVTGKGNIEVKDGAKENEEVTFTVTPSDGYEISDVIVVDEDGNTIPVTDNKFIMPGKNVTVKVVFSEIYVEEILPENPPTGLIIPLSIILVLIISSYMILKHRKNKIYKF